MKSRKDIIDYYQGEMHPCHHKKTHRVNIQQSGNYGAFYLVYYTNSGVVLHLQVTGF